MGVMKIIFIFLWLLKGDECMTVTVQIGGNVTIPCHYESKYTQHKKYWCYHSSGWYSSCSPLAYANETNGDVSVIDHPDQSLFTVTMRDLQHKNTGTYWCAVEIENYWDVTEEFYLKIKSAPDLSVMSSSVTVDEGGNISIQCLYSIKYKDNTKQWCRYKDKRCYTSQNASVEISDDGRESLTVVMSGLMKSDSGWYYCSVGDLQAPFQLTVNAVTTYNNSATRDMKDIHVIMYNDLKMWPLLIVLLLLLILVTVTSVILRNKHRRKNNHISKEKTDKVSDKDDSANSSSVNPECDVTYSSVINLPKTEAPMLTTRLETPALYDLLYFQCGPADVEDNVIYSSVHV
nr:uncharacterized protein LOC129441716 [Misgurnus anguillicaudatus]